jgi:protein-S-isoprenylcysteine O-methyltransferase Ste14
VKPGAGHGADRDMRPRRLDVHGAGAAVLTVCGVTGLPALLRRMTRDVEEQGALRAPTAAWMYATYGVHAAGYASALRTGPPRPAGGWTVGRAAGAATAVVGAALTVAGMSRFAGAAHVSGTQSGPFVTEGVYRFSRNPQYTGYVLTLAGAALARRSVPALVLATAAAGVFVRWVPVEERHLSTSIGTPYVRYLESTPRWLGWAGARAPRPR